jgi:uncharacterized protein YlxW (UPF0749 family)
MNIETSTLTIGSFMVLGAFIITVVSQYRAYKTRIVQATEREVNLYQSNESLKNDLRRLENEFITFKAEVKAEIKEIDGDLSSRLERFDTKLDLIKNLIIDKLSK